MKSAGEKHKFYMVREYYGVVYKVCLIKLTKRALRVDIGQGHSFS
jgi:hypothetical protein